MILSLWILVVQQWRSTLPKRPWVFNALHPHATHPRGSPCPHTLPLLLRKLFLTLLHRLKSFCPRIFWKYILKKIPNLRKAVPLFFCRRSPFSALWRRLLPQQWLQSRPPILHHHPLQQVINLIYTHRFRSICAHRIDYYVYRYIIILSVWYIILTSFFLKAPPPTLNYLVATSSLWQWPLTPLMPQRWPHPPSLWVSYL